MIDQARNQPLDIDQLRLDPGSVFASPEALLECHALPTDQKIDILRRWQYDATEIAVTEEEGCRVMARTIC